MKGTALVQHRANDLSRASGLHGEKLSPILLIRGELGNAALTVADGYHPICANYHINPDSDIPYRIGDLLV